MDGDIVAYRCAFSAKGGPEGEALSKTDTLVNYILEQTIAHPFPCTSEYHVYLTGSDNFRYEIAKSYPYKANRTAQEKPEHLGAVRQYLQETRPTTVSYGEEADDLISIAATLGGPDTIIASIDKDFLQVPCKHYNFVKDEWTTVTPEEGIKFFYTQVLTGDAVDNIKGLHRVGPVKASKILEGLTTEQELYKACLDAYDGDVERVLENARLLWLRRYEGEMWECPIKASIS